MKFPSLFSATALALTIVLGCSVTPKKKTPKAVFIVIDGIPADVIENVQPSALQQIKTIGSYTRCYVGGNRNSYNQTPTISAPGYMSLVTGTWGNKHNVWDNDVAAPNYNYWNIFRIVEETHPTLKTAIFSTWEDNRIKLLGEGLKEAGSLTLDFKFDGLERDTIKYPHDDQSNYILEIDAAVAREAARYITTDGPDVSWIYLQHTDDIGHRFGDSPRFHDAINSADHQIEEIWEAIKTREEEYAEDWLLIVTTDHGRDATTGKNHGDQSDRERTTWIVTNKSDLNERFKKSPAVVDILPSILNHLRVTIPDAVLGELDGVPFIGEVDLANLQGEKNGDSISISWKNFSQNESDKAEVFFTTTNYYSEGAVDKYQKAGDVLLRQEKFTFAMPTDSTFAKVMVKGPHHYQNVWIDEATE